MISIFINILQYDDITYKDFQELSKPRLKLLFNELIDSIEIKEPEMSNPEISRKTPVAITINMKVSFTFSDVLLQADIDKASIRITESIKLFLFVDITSFHLIITTLSDYTASMSN